MKRWIETSFLRAASLILIWGSLNLVLLSMKDLHSSTSSELVMGLNLRPGFEVLRYQTPSVLLNIKEFLLCSACVVKPSDVCHDCQHTILPTDWFLVFVPVSICMVRLAWSPVGAPGPLSGSPFSKKWCPSGLDYQECVGGEAVRQQSKEAPSVLPLFFSQQLNPVWSGELFPACSASRDQSVESLQESNMLQIKQPEKSTHVWEK